jgi:electron transfer flavoprotein alpha subunit
MAVNCLVVTDIVNGEFRKVSLEALSEARRLIGTDGQVTALMIGQGIDQLGAVPARYGADVVMIADDPQVKDYHPDRYTDTVQRAAQLKQTDVILIPATDIGKDLAPRVAARLDAGLAEDCLKLTLTGDRLEADRPMFAGKVISRVAVLSKIKVVTLRPNVFALSEPASSSSGVMEKLDVQSGESKLNLKEFRESASAKIDVSEAEIVVTGGRGMKGPENFAMLETLADLLGGAVGATRAAVDAGWRPHSDQVGQTGKTVTPNLYLMFGASGSIQHWAGMSGAKCIVAVNKNPEAPIISKADYSIVADLFEVVPVLTEEIRKIRG